MNLLEKDLEQIIFKTQNELLQEKGLPIFGKKLQQIKIGAYGIADIISYYKTYENDIWVDFENEKKIYLEETIPTLNVNIYELKKDKISMSSFLQLVGYVKGIINYFKHKHFINYKINLILIGKEIDINSEFIYLTDVFDNIEFYKYKYNFDGLKFKKMENYCLTNENF